MATQTVNLASHPGQVGTTLQLWSIDTHQLIQSAPAAESSWMSGLYSADFTDAPAATYRVQHVDSYGDLIWTSAVTLTLSTATFQAHDAALASGGGLDAAGVRSAIGLASANLDTQLASIGTAVVTTIPGQIAALPSAATTASSVMSALGSGTQVFGHSYLESIKRIEVASGAATLSGAGSGTEVMTSSDGSKTATFTVDGSGNVSAVVWT